MQADGNSKSDWTPECLMLTHSDITVLIWTCYRWCAPRKCWQQTPDITTAPRSGKVVPTTQLGVDALKARSLNQYDSMLTMQQGREAVNNYKALLSSWFCLGNAKPESLQPIYLQKFCFKERQKERMKLTDLHDSCISSPVANNRHLTIQPLNATDCQPQQLVFPCV